MAPRDLQPLPSGGKKVSYSAANKASNAPSGPPMGKLLMAMDRVRKKGKPVISGPPSYVNAPGSLRESCTNTDPKVIAAVPFRHRKG